MTKERFVFGQFLFGSSPGRAERGEKVLRYVIHRIDEHAALRDILQEPYVQRNCSRVEIDEIKSNPELVHSAREHMEQAFRLGELALGYHLPTSEEES